ncbi:SusC/RagA family TonB-linked outer membrane protein [Pedobacter sp. SL55]|uniref:SusC/RagA family TonB-linked outer membrane protein n=1 Tax=Pedobacter sp. SL55 TaxID=2995161 RepID=UPI002271A8D7|nr:SusC/RagA family TonB-linked outer membrane protein [Pedobacter sp. SL55]WAC40390.1 SusC/RagA family TonB-linked outer membrane protein [Pedobacter sp. SL55]
MNQLLANTDLIHQQTKSSIVIFKKGNKTVSLLPNTQDQIVVNGKVSDRAGPMQSVMVKEEGLSNAVATNAEGGFSIKTRPNATLVFTFIGYVTQRIKVVEGKFLDIKMLADSKVLDEVMVVGYGTKKKAAFTGAATTLDTNVLSNSPRASFAESFQGNVPGVMSVSGDGVLGSASDVTIRGLGSYSASNAPLYVIDGVPIINADVSGYNTSTLSAVNSEDIESITILKDASATSIYGSRGANGVIIITTKQGRPGKTTFTATAQGGVNQYTIPESSRPLNTTEMLQLLREGWNNSGRNPGGFAQAVADAGIDYTVSTDWLKQVMQIGNFQRYNISVNGGNDRTKFFSSFGLYNSEGAQKGVDYNRFNGRLNIENKATDKLTFTGSISGAYQVTNSTLRSGLAANPTRSSFRLQPWLKVRNDDDSYDLSYYISGFNPVAIIENNIYRANTLSALGSVGATYKIIPELTFESKASAEFIYSDRKLFYAPGFGDGLNVNGRGVFGTTKHINWSATNILRYTKRFNQKHDLNAYVGYEAQKVSRTFGDATATNFLPNTNTLANASVLTSITSGEAENALNSVFLNSSYSFDNKYYIDASVRRDGSSRFGRQNRFSNFWSAGLAWNILQEKFLRNSRLFNQLKIRSSYGTSGNQEIGDFVALPLYTSGNDYNGQPGYAFSQYENPMLTWESAKQFDVGMEFKILKSRISGTIDYFVRRTDGLLYNLPISSTNGTTTFTDNLGEIKNSGFEVDLNFLNIKPANANGLSWRTNVNFTTFKNRILRLETSFEDQELALNSFTLATYAGVDPLNGESLWYTNSSRTATTNDWSRAGRSVQGTALPKFYGGLTNTFSLKRFTFSFLIYYNFGNKVLETYGPTINTDGSVGFGDVGAMTRYTYNNRWQKPGDVTDVPKIVFLGSQSGLSNQTSTRFLYNGGFVRLRDVQFSYLFPTDLSKKLKVSRISTFIKANNLLTWKEDKRLQFDPQVSTSGQLDFKPPVFRTLTLGITIQP